VAASVGASVGAAVAVGAGVSVGAGVGLGEVVGLGVGGVVAVTTPVVAVEGTVEVTVAAAGPAGCVTIVAVAGNRVALGACCVLPQAVSASNAAQASNATTPTVRGVDDT
jgi:hypothetical protein